MRMSAGEGHTQESTGVVQAEFTNDQQRRLHFDAPVGLLFFPGRQDERTLRLQIGGGAPGKLREPTLSPFCKQRLDFVGIDVGFEFCTEHTGCGVEGGAGVEFPIVQASVKVRHAELRCPPVSGTDDVFSLEVWGVQLSEMRYQI